MSLTINGLPVATMTVRIPWSGVWTAEIELGASADVTPTGRVAIVSTDGDTFTSTVDDDRSSNFSERRHVRVLGGAAGWQKPVRAQHFHDDVGVRMQELASVTAAEVAETVIVDPSLIGAVDFWRRAAEASQIFADAGVDWWVGLDGATRVGKRQAGTAPADLQVLDWSPEESTVSFTCSNIVEPGTIIVDARFDGTKIVREVEARYENASVGGSLRLADAAADAGSVSELYDALAAIARTATRCEASRFYLYRVVEMQGERAVLQAIDAGAPDLVPVSIRPGASGIKADLLPSSEVLVGFIAGDPRRPFVAFYAALEGDWQPTSVTIDALTSITLGDEEGALPVVRATQAFAAWITAVTAAVNTVAPGSAVPPIDIASQKVRAS